MIRTWDELLGKRLKVEEHVVGKLLAQYFTRLNSRGEGSRSLERHVPSLSDPAV